MFQKFQFHNFNAIFFSCTTVALCFASTIATGALSVTVQFNCPFYIVFIAATITRFVDNNIKTTLFVSVVS